MPIADSLLIHPALTNSSTFCNLAAGCVGNNEDDWILKTNLSASKLTSDHLIVSIKSLVSVLTVESTPVLYSDLLISIMIAAVSSKNSSYCLVKEVNRSLSVSLNSLIARPESNPAGFLLDAVN